MTTQSKPGAIKWLRPQRNSDKLRLTGAVVMALGLIAALLVWWQAGSGDAALMREGYEIVGGQVYASQQARAAREMQLERIGGHAAVWAANFNEWLAEQFEGRRLAVTLVVLAGVVSVVLFRIARLMDDLEHFDAGEQERAADS